MDGPLRVVCVDDAPSFRTLFVATFAYEDEFEAIALQPEEALHRGVDWGADHALLVDWHMPGYDACGIIERARDHNPLLRCAVLTAFPDVVRRDSRVVPHITVLEKPIGRDHLVEVLRDRER